MSSIMRIRFFRSDYGAGPARVIKRPSRGKLIRPHAIGAGYDDQAPMNTSGRLALCHLTTQLVSFPLFGHSGKRMAMDNLCNSMKSVRGDQTDRKKTILDS